MPGAGHFAGVRGRHRDNPERLRCRAKPRSTARPATRPRAAAPVADPCLLVIFGASGDLTKRLLMPALYNLACDGLLPERFAIVGIAMDEMSTDEFRAG